MDIRLAAGDEERSRKKAIGRAILALILTMVALTFFSNTLLTLSLAEVTVEQAAAGPLSHVVTGSGIVEAAETADLYAETNWPVSDVRVKVGDKVEAGQELVVFKTRDTEDTLKDSQARYEQKRLSLLKLQENYQDSVRSGDEKQTRSLSRDIESIQLDMQILERQIANLQRQLTESSQLRAPVAGVVTELNAVKGAAVPSGKPALRIADWSKGQQLKATIDIAKAPYVAVGDETEILFAALNNARIKAKITEIRDAVDGASAASRKEQKEMTLTLRDDRLNGGEAGEFTITKKSATLRALLPNEAVREDDKGTYVLVLKEKKGPLGSEYVLQRASVQTGDADDGKTSIDNGITPLDKVVVSSSKPVAEGDRVLNRSR
ncbi:efflux RND transporter periplasmic adaptor subunit [Paenibacillus silviterrae]|uniref:efflux RND transporter periplasmic adaptor subunit n=1 Tax=Paenibacillus silviterrae TaxID=3242194 RepID=UPI0025439AD3|nr:efflux RND transporter periplasmic adaptor subunit [Paenibacillus chinjuensis]